MAIKIGVPRGTQHIGHVGDVTGSRRATTPGGGSPHGLQAAAGTKTDGVPRNAKLPGLGTLSKLPGAGLLNLPGLIGAGRELAHTGAEVLSGQKSLGEGAKEAFQPAATLLSAVPGPVGLAATAATVAAPVVENLMDRR
jgi:hypothetical protein